MSARTMNVLFICTGNSARSILAESILNHPSIGQGRFRAFSAGSHPAGQVQPLALELLSQYHYPTEGLRSKSWNEFSGDGAPELDFVFTVCDKAAGEACPYWPGQPMTAHWGVEDPVAVQGSHEEQRRAYANAFMVLRNRLSMFAALPIDKLDRLALKKKLDEIGQARPVALA
ncbi:MAG: arsenate reductase ArsC [Ottowia sp.]|nr:arsenate reductase ArsC [Ottowia sp.]MBP7327208.1 arsenate reductase ArsC [Alicycliphilus sp.]MBP9953847.1 arsenate reductase ArsC [Ottowia sp.]